MKEYLTVKEFAAMANKKPQTIYKQLDKRLKPYVKIENGQKVISAEALETFYKAEAVEQPSQPNSTDFQPNSTDFQPSSTDVQPNSTEGEQPKSTAEDDQITALNKLIEMVQKQLEEKDKQLAVKDKQIADLSDRLAEALQLTKGQQYIAAADKTKELIAADGGRRDEDRTDPDINAAAYSSINDDPRKQEEKKQQPQKKKGFFARLFGL